ncbi:MAG: transcriptional regulator [Gammaproteobacteria bacterium CG22_combo_CG10-13_8_21_14_all_40_8]|nr:MAG: transcriptional regulator [Gammaproteobacteria bacterium CG22_combo_CG10-13_8_21_14_all_40_8]
MSSIEMVLTALRRVIRATDLHSRYLSKTSGLTTPQLIVLKTISDKNQITIGELAKEISLSQATVTTIIDRMEKKQLVQRERSTDDKRKVYVVLTEQGQQMLEHSPTPLQDNFILQFQALENWEQNMIIASLQRVAHMMDAGDIDASPVLDVGPLDRLPDANL